LINEKSMALKGFLDSLSSKNTRDIYQRGIQKFCEWSGKTVDQILEERKADLTPKPNEDLITAKQRANRFEKDLEKFYLELIKKTETRDAYIPSTAYNYTKGILQLLRFYNMGVSLRSGSPITQGASFEGQGRFDLSIEDVRKLFWQTRDLKFKTYLAISTDLGFRVNDVLSMRVKDLPDLDRSTPIEFKLITSKEKVIGHTCLSKLTVDCLKEMINVYELKPDNLLFDFSVDTVERRLKEVATECGIDYKGHGHFSTHMFRDLRIKTAQKLSIDEHIYKRMVGKTISRSMRGYSSKDVKEAFIKMAEILSINGQILAKENNDSLTELGRQVATLTNLVTDQQKQMKKQSEKLAKFDLVIKALQAEIRQPIKEIAEQAENE
jgi:hypothetical protein